MDQNIKENLLVDVITLLQAQVNNLTQIIADVHAHDGVTQSPLARIFDDPPAYQTLITALYKQIEKQDKWLEARKEEVTNLQNCLTDAYAKNKLLKEALEENNILNKAIKNLLRKECWQIREEDLDYQIASEVIDVKSARTNS